MVYQSYSLHVDKDRILQADVQKDEKHSCLLTCVIIAYTIESIGNAFKQQRDRNTCEAKDWKLSTSEYICRFFFLRLTHEVLATYSIHE